MSTPPAKKLLSDVLTAEVAGIIDLTHDVRLIELRMASPLTLPFAAGQFVTFKVPRPGVQATLSRAYSIASAPQSASRLELVFNLVPGGPGSTYLYERAKGELLEFRGPAGTFVLQPELDRDLLFVATGTGIAPLRSMILAALPRQRRVTLFWGLRSERDLYFQEEWQALADTYPQFSFAITLSRPDGQWQGPVGRVQRLIEERIPSVTSLAAYVCGSSAMIDSVKTLLCSRGPCHVYSEQYYREVTAASPASP